MKYSSLEKVNELSKKFERTRAEFERLRKTDMLMVDASGPGFFGSVKLPLCRGTDPANPTDDNELFVVLKDAIVASYQDRMTDLVQKLNELGVTLSQ